MVKPEDVAESIPEMDELTDVQQEKITEFLSLTFEQCSLAELPLLWKREDTQERRVLLAYKFLKARRWHVKNAVDMCNSTIAFRKENGLDEWALFPSAFPLLGIDEQQVVEVVSNIPGCGGVSPREGVSTWDCCYRALQASYVNVYHYCDKEGHPVLYDCCGWAEPSTILRDLSQAIPPGKTMKDVIVPYHTYMNEVQYYLIRHASEMAKKNGTRDIMGITVIMNVQGLSFNMMQKRFVQIVRAIFDVDQHYYPETLHRLFVINCPGFIQFAFNLVKGSLDENTRKKVTFCSPSESLAVLQRVIDEDKIPAELGGQCSCAGGCLPKYQRPGAATSSCDGEGGSVARGLTEIPTELVHVSAGKCHEWSTPVAAGDEVSWEFAVDHSMDILFTVTFFAAANGDEVGEAENSPVARKGNSQESSRETKSSKRGKSKSGTTDGVRLKEERTCVDVDSYAAETAGTLTLVWDNKSSWVHGKKVSLRVSRSKAQL